MEYTLRDSGSVNPFPPLVFVSIYPAGVQKSESNLVASGYTLLGGRIELNLTPSTDYVAEFEGTQAPEQPVSFTSAASDEDFDALTIVVEPYTSPALTAAGYANAIFDIFPDDWLNEAAQLPGGVAYALMQAVGAELAAVEYQAQLTQASMRLASCEGNQLVTWAADYLGDFPRYPGETDDHYRARISVALQTPNCTLESIRSKVQAYIDANPAAQQGSVMTFDFQSDPALSEQVGIADEDGKFCVVLPVTYDSANAFFAGRTFAGRNSFLISLDRLNVATDIDPNILAIVDAAKTGGFRPIYAQMEV